MPENIFAWTAPGADFPAFISVNKVGDMFEIHVRSTKELNGQASILLTREVFDQLSLQCFNWDGTLET